MRANQQRREELEQRYWTASPLEAPGSDSIDAVASKMSEALVFLEKLRAYRQDFEEADVILEIGGGQGWGACILKHELRHEPLVVTSDIAPDAVASLPQWEQTLRVRVNGGLASRSYELPLRSGSVDLVVVFAAAHHFGAHRRTLAEIARVLCPGGRAIYLHEPACRRFVHRLALRRVMAKRPVVLEDVLVTTTLTELAADVGLTTTVQHAPTTTARAPFETIYYLALQRLTWLQRVLPCSVDLIFRKGCVEEARASLPSVPYRARSSSARRSSNSGIETVTTVNNNQKKASIGNTSK